MSNISRRNFIGSAIGIAALPESLMSAEAAQKNERPRRSQALLRVQYTTGGHTVPLSSYTMFTDDTFSNFDTIALPHPNAFRNLNGESKVPGPDVLVLYDFQMEGYNDTDLRSIRKYVDSGKGLVVLHHALCDNQRVSWWREEITGGSLIQIGIEGVKFSRLKQFPVQTIQPVGDHPIVRGLPPFMLPRDEVFVDMWMSPKITPLLQSSDPNLSNKTIAWIGVHPKGRVTCLQPGHTGQVCAHPRYRQMVHNMILWSGGKLS
jgi:type 1 glutamine amidotransferase